MTEQDKNDKDDQDWLKIIAGHEAAGADKSTRAEAKEVRKVLLLGEQTQHDDVKLKRAEKELLQRLKDEKLVDNKKSLFNAFSLAAVAASVVLVAISLNIVINIQTIPNVSEDFSDYPIYRDKNQYQVLKSRDPEELVENLKHSLHKLKVPYRFTKNLSDWSVEFYVVDNKNQTLNNLMAKHNLSVDSHGWVKVNVSNEKD